MRFAELVESYEKIESTSSRISMTYYLVDLFKKTSEDEIDKVVYLTEGKLYPEFVGIELGMAEKMALRVLSMASGLSQEKVENEYKKRGDIGIIAENILNTKTQQTLFRNDLTVQDVYAALDKIARISGSGSADTKMRTLSGLLTDASPKEAKYIIRIVTGKMRLGIADMTIIDALSQAFANVIARGASTEAGVSRQSANRNKDKIERIYNITSDIGEIAKVLKSGKSINEFHVKAFRPIKMMLAQRMESADGIIKKMREESLGRPICEYKYDGERVQIHKDKNKVLLFSRNLENITEQYPDIVKLALQNFKADNAIAEGECVAVNPDTGEMLPFQELMHRRRKYDIEEKSKEFPINMYLFDILMKDGQDLMNLPFIERRNILKESIIEGSEFKIASQIISQDTKEIEAFFENAIQNGCEGLVLKGENTFYKAGARGWQWIKLKRSYQSKMIEPIDVVVVGAFMGRGRRSGNYGALLVAVYDHDKDMFDTISKLGSGFTDEELKKIPEILSQYKLDKKHPRVNSYLEPDIWFIPTVVMEVIGDELTLSPIHTCGYGEIRDIAGIAIRFPRFTHNFRWDKSPEDATSVKEVIQMYKSQLKRIESKDKI